MASQMDGPLSRDMHILTITPTSHALEADIRARCNEQKQPVLLVLPDVPVPTLQSPQDFLMLKQLKRELNIPIFFIIPANEKLRSWAQHYKFPVFASRAELDRSLTLRQYKARKPSQRPPAGGLITHPFASSNPSGNALSAAAPTRHNRPRFVVQDYIEGESLEDYLTRLDAPMEEPTVLAIAAQILENMEPPDRPLAHGDIRPANIVIDIQNNHVRLIGFPNPATVDEQQEATRKPDPGTPGYSSPERMQGVVDVRSDLYALAATMYRMLANRDPATFPQYNLPPVTLFNPHVPVETERLLARALAYDPDLRYQHASDMRHAITDLLVTHKGAKQGTKHATPFSLNMVALETMSEHVFSGSGETFGDNHHSFRPLKRRMGPPRSLFRDRSVLIPFLAFALILVIGAEFVIPSPAKPRVQPAPSSSGARLSAKPHVQHAPPVSNPGIGVTPASDGEYIGLSDGAFAFDTGTDRLDRLFKIQASERFSAGDTAGAVTLWHTALLHDPSDAEVHIYLEDQQVLDSGRPYVTLVVGTMLTGVLTSLGRDDLQGAYIAQQEYNNGLKLPGGVQIRLLVANAGSGPIYAASVAQQIVRAAQHDPSIIGVMGWPYSTYTLSAIKALTQAHIPLVSQTASSNDLDGISPYFFRVVSSDTTQACAGATYIEHVLHDKAAALFLDPSNTYTKTIGDAFKQQFLKDGNQIVATETYTMGHPETVIRALQDALTHHPDVIYFAGPATDASTLLVDLPTSGPLANLFVVGSDWLDMVDNYTQAARAYFPRMRFTAFVYPDEWEVQNLEKQMPAFFSNYANTFDPLHQHDSYGYDRADGDAMLSYDATMVMLEAARLALQNTPGHISSDALCQALVMLNGPQAIQGVAGQIAFGPDGNPINKAVVILDFSVNGDIEMVGVQGQFLKGS